MFSNMILVTMKRKPHRMQPTGVAFSNKPLPLHGGRKQEWKQELPLAHSLTHFYTLNLSHAHTHPHAFLVCVCVCARGSECPPYFSWVWWCFCKDQSKASSTLFFNRHNLCSYFLHTQTVASGIFQKTEANIVLEFCL